MSAPLPAELKARIPEEMRAELERIAAARFLKVSDIVREAVRYYLARRPVPPHKRSPKAS